MVVCVAQDGETMDISLGNHLTIIDFLIHYIASVSVWQMCMHNVIFLTNNCVCHRNGPFTTKLCQYVVSKLATLTKVFLHIFLEKYVSMYCMLFDKYIALCISSMY